SDSLSIGHIVNLNLELDHEPRAFNLRRLENTDHLLAERTHSRSTIIRRISEAVTPKMPILWRMLLSSRLSYRRCRWQNSNENGHKEGFCRESSTSSSTSFFAFGSYG
ncbi:unnamed protein product, partial [Hymenolepis diminuta]